ncbi:MAG: SagB/ThcOx family dehydrogenase [Anaerolineae bacterium]|nr:SagB/ThcOx family dehydrogenase [Anaerolineae bacterium]MDW8071133.1 SagB/ThcOx family dehydrogenase [Anaerolineae bacterium]
MARGIGHQFMVQTYYRYLAPSDQSKGLPQPPLQLPYNPDQPVIPLPAPTAVEVRPVTVREAIETRRSVRHYAPTHLSLEELSFLLWCTQGVKEVSGRQVTLRTVPSAGARHAFETYLLVNRVAGLPSGLYRFLALEHKLLQLDLDPRLSDKVTEACWNQQFVKQSAVTFIWSAVVYRMTWRYGERGYRYLHLDAGHVCQNLYLAAAAVDCGVCAIAAYNDEAMNALIGLDGAEQFVIYLATVGKRDRV